MESSAGLALHLADEARALLDSIVQDPLDDTVRLAYADWLEERGQDRHAKFIRRHIYLATLGPNVRKFRIVHQDGDTRVFVAHTYWPVVGEHVQLTANNFALYAVVQRVISYSESLVHLEVRPQVCEPQMERNIVLDECLALLGKPEPGYSCYNYHRGFPDYLPTTFVALHTDEHLRSQVAKWPLTRLRIVTTCPWDGTWFCGDTDTYDLPPELFTRLQHAKRRFNSASYEHTDIAHMMLMRATCNYMRSQCKLPEVNFPLAKLGEL